MNINKKARKSKHGLPLYKAWYFWLCMVALLFFVLVSSIPAKISGMSEVKTRRLCSKAFAARSGELRSGTVIESNEAKIQEKSDSAINIDRFRTHNWYGLTGIYWTEFQCTIDKYSGEIYKLYVFYNPYNDPYDDGDMQVLLDKSLDD